MLFDYKAIKSDGTRVAGQVEGLNEDDAIRILQDKKLIIVSVYKIKDKVPADIKAESSFFSTLFKKRITQKDVIVFSRQISTLFQSGVSALRSFRLVAEESSSIELKNILTAIADDIESGLAISQAMGKYNNIFGTFYSSMIKAGEESGKLDESFSYLADYLDRNYDISQKIKKASIYPLFVIGTFIAVMIVMIVFVIPNLANMLFEEGTSLPFITKVVLGLGNIGQKYGILIIIGFAFLGYYVYHLIKTPAGKEYIDYLKLKIPVFSSLYKKIYLARITDSLDTMLTSGVQIVRSLEITSDVVDNYIYKNILLRVGSKVKTGKSLSDAFYEEEELPNVLVQMTKIGEETGRLGYILGSLSTYYKREATTAIDTSLSLIEPALILCLAGGVGFLIAAIMIPMFSVVTNV